MSKEILVCGGAGYIGSHMVYKLLELGYTPLVFDNLSTGCEAFIGKSRFNRGDLLDKVQLRAVFSSHQIFAVMHFAAKSIVSESFEDPHGYYTNNLIGTMNLIEAMRDANVDKLIFSSTAAVYGNPVSDRILESHPTIPINPYGNSKLLVERYLSDLHQAMGLNSVCFRYFNAAGAHRSGEIGEAHEPETHLIPNVLNSLINPLGKERLSVFGDDYPTPDGSCIRDYVHVEDIAAAHALALDFLTAEPGFHVFNLGTENGCSVLEVLRACERVTGLPVPFDVKPRRKGDPAVLVANSTKSREILEWKPIYSTIEDVVDTAWNWHRNTTTGK